MTTTHFVGGTLATFDEAPELEAGQPTLHEALASACSVIWAATGIRATRLDISQDGQFRAAYAFCGTRHQAAEIAKVGFSLWQHADGRWVAVRRTGSMTTRGLRYVG